MSIAVMTRIWKSSATKGSGLLLLLAIGDNANEDGIAWPGIETLAAKTRLSEHQVIRLVKETETHFADELIVEHGGHGRKHHNRYCILTGLTPDGSQAARQFFQEWIEKGDKMARFREQRKGDISTQKRRPITRKGDISSGKGDIAMSPESSIEPSEEDQLNHQYSPDGEHDEPPKEIKRPLNARQAAIKFLEERFSTISALDLPARTTDKEKKAAAERWWTPLGKIWELCDKDTARADLLLTGAYNAMIADQLDVSAPASVLNKALAINALQRRANGNGQTPGEPLLTDPVLRAIQRQKAAAHGAN